MAGSDNIGKGTVVVYIERGVLMVTGLVVSALLARGLTTDHYGIYKLVGSVLLFSSYAASFGLESTVSRFIPDFLTNDRPKAVNRLLGAAVLIRGAAIAILVAVAVGFRTELGTLLNADAIFGPLLPLVLAYAGFSLVNKIIGDALLTAYSRRHTVGYVRIVSNVMVVGLIGYLYLTDQGIMFAIGVLAAQAATEFLLFAIAGLPHVLANMRAASESEGSLPMKRLGSYSGYNWMFKGGHVFREYAVDHLVITYFLGPSQVAMYGVAVAIPSMLRSVSPGRMLHGVLLPSFVQRFEESGSYDELIKGYVLLQKINLSVLVPAIVTLFVFAPEMIELVYSSKYVQAAETARILIAFALFHSMSDPFYLFSHASERANLVFYSSLWGLYNFGANFALIPLMGVNGAALATGTAGLLVLGYFIVVYRTLYDVEIPLLGSSLLQTLLNALPMLGLYGASKMVGTLTIWGLLLMTAGALSYAALALYNDVFSETERSLLLRRIDVPLLHRIWGSPAKEGAV